MDSRGREVGCAASCRPSRFIDWTPQISCLSRSGGRIASPMCFRTEMGKWHCPIKYNYPLFRAPRPPKSQCGPPKPSERYARTFGPGVSYRTTRHVSKPTPPNSGVQVPRPPVPAAPQSLWTQPLYLERPYCDRITPVHSRQFETTSLRTLKLRKSEGIRGLLSLYLTT